MAPDRQPNYPTRPISPNEVLATKVEAFPEEVFVAVNGLIAERLHGQYAELTIKAIRARMEELGLDRKEIAARGWDRVGAVYRDMGWDVHVHYPDEDSLDFDPYYSFNTRGVRSW